MRRQSLSPWTPQGVIVEREPSAEGPVDAATVFLTAAECPIGCSMCDLWHNTLMSRTPRGAIPKQINAAAALCSGAQWIKLYNSGNFFDPRSTPVEDEAAIADGCSPFQRVVVENHPRIGKDRVERFRDRLQGRLEVAVGLETVQPRWLHRMGKRMTRDQFAAYARWLKTIDVDLRVFLIVGVPGITAVESIRWARLSTRYASDLGARHISLIPARAGHGWNRMGDQLPELSLTMMGDLLGHAIDDVRQHSCVTVDLWSFENGGRAELLNAIRRTNETQDGGSR